MHRCGKEEWVDIRASLSSESNQFRVTQRTSWWNRDFSLGLLPLSPMLSLGGHTQKVYVHWTFCLLTAEAPQFLLHFPAFGWKSEVTCLQVSPQPQRLLENGRLNLSGTHFPIEHTCILLATELWHLFHFFFHCPPSSTELRMGKNSSHCTTLTLQLHPHQGFCLSQTQTRPLVHPLSYKDKHVPYFVSHLSFPNLSSYLPQEPVYGGNPNHVTFKKIFVSLTTWILGGRGEKNNSFLMEQKLLSDLPSTFSW